MKSHRHFLDRIDDAKVVAAIAAAEKKTSAEIRVFVSHHRAPDALSVAREQFRKLKMSRTKHRNAVLVFVAPRSQTFAIVADVAAHDRCGQATWDRRSAELASHFRGEKFTDGLVHVIDKLGDCLATFFPPDSSSGNELPDDVLHD